MTEITPEEVSRLQAYFQKKFKNTGFAFKLRDKIKDSAEVLLDGEVIGIVYKDDDDPKEVSYDFNMGILQVDMEQLKA